MTEKYFDDFPGQRWMAVILEKFLHGLDGSLYLAHVAGEGAGKSKCERTSESACEGSGAALLVEHIAGGVLLHHKSSLYEEVQEFGQLLLTFSNKGSVHGLVFIGFFSRLCGRRMYLAAAPVPLMVRLMKND